MSWADIGFRIEITGDESPSLRLLQSLQEKYAEGESMHHSGGALTETNLIYGECIRQTFSRVRAPHFLVVGLGLGYIEMFIAREALLADQLPASILSFESVPRLREYFVGWIHNLKLPTEVQQTYDHVLSCILAGTTLQKVEIQKLLKQFFRSPDDIRGPLESFEFQGLKYHCILYDAFSSKTTPQLWEEDFLYNFLQSFAAPICFFATYACKGSLKRALKAQGFILDLQEGFKSKRNRVSARRSELPVASGAP